MAEPLFSALTIEPINKQTNKPGLQAIAQYNLYQHQHDMNGYIN